jgi:hypothetical protein
LFGVDVLDPLVSKDLFYGLAERRCSDLVRINHRPIGRHDAYAGWNSIRDLPEEFSRALDVFLSIHTLVHVLVDVNPSMIALWSPVIATRNM